MHYKQVSAWVLKSVLTAYIQLVHFPSWRGTKNDKRFDKYRGILEESRLELKSKRSLGWKIASQPLYKDVICYRIIHKQGSILF